MQTVTHIAAITANGSVSSRTKRIGCVGKPKNFRHALKILGVSGTQIRTAKGPSNLRAKAKQAAPSTIRNNDPSDTCTLASCCPISERSVRENIVNVLVRSNGGEFALMELELIEPALYFRMDNKAPLRFAVSLENFVSDIEG